MLNILVRVFLMYKTLTNYKGNFHLMTLISFLIFIFFLSHIFFGERSVWKIFELKSQISKSQEEYELLVAKKKKILLQINLLRDNNLDSDLVSEIAHRNLGLIESDQIVLDLQD
jgi:cell division protein FtsB